MSDGRELEPLHSHDWVVEAIFTATELDNTGCVIDFRDIDQLLKNTTDNWSDKGIGALSAEVIARSIFDQIDIEFKKNDNSRVKIQSVTVWEDMLHAGSFFQ